MTTREADIREALGYVPARDRETWVRMGMAVKAELGDPGFELWNEWSQADESYREPDARAVWRGFRESGKIGVGTLFHEAKSRGWRRQNGSAPLSPSPAELAARDARRRRAEAEEASRRSDAAAKALAIYKASAPARSDHPYLERKRVLPVPTLRELPVADLTRLVGYEAKAGDDVLTGRVLIAPVRIGDGLSSLEFIDEGGRKSALAGGAKAGGFWSAQPLPDGDGEGETLYLAEGVATALSVRSSTESATFAALSAGNLLRAAEALRSRYRKAAIVVCADVGAGNEKAHAAARAVHGLVATPDFGAGRPDGAKDFNDLAQHLGEEAVKTALQRHTLPDAPEYSPAHKNAAQADSGPCAVVRRLSDVQAKPIRWLWPGRLARGKVSMIAGHPGLGKSQLTAALAAVVTTGGAWPVDRTACERGSVLLLNAEDDAADTIRPRLEAAGADLTCCEIVDAVVDGYSPDGSTSTRGFSLKSDLKVLDALLEQRPDAALVVIDPITAYLSGVDSHVNADVRAVLAPLGELAAKHGVAIVCVSHLNKGGPSRGAAGEAQLRVSGSLAFVAAARAAFIVVRDQDEPSRRLFLPAKNNIGKDESGLAFRVESHVLDSRIETSRVMWEPALVAISADEAMAPPPDDDDRSMTDEAVELLHALLESGRMLSREVKAKAKEAGITDKALRNARSRLNVETFREGFGADTKTFWRLPSGSLVPSEPTHAHTQRKAPMGKKGTNGAAGEVEEIY